MSYLCVVPVFSVGVALAELPVCHNKDTELGEMGCSGDVCTEPTDDLARVGSVETYRDNFTVVWEMSIAPSEPISPDTDDPAASSSKLQRPKPPLGVWRTIAITSLDSDCTCAFVVDLVTVMNKWVVLFFFFFLLICKARRPGCVFAW